MPLIALLLALCALLTGTQGANSDDAFTVTTETDWFRAMDHAVELRSYCQSWHGAPRLSCLDVFSRSGKTAKTFTKKRFRAHAYDLATRAGDDILSRTGFYEVLDLALMLLPYSLLALAPPCSLFIPISQSVHQRSDLFPFGNILNYKVRMSTLIAENTAFLMNLILQFRPDIFIFLEQPKGTTMWHLPAFADVIEAAGMTMTLTYLGLFGLEILKATKLLSNLPTMNRLARRATKEAKKRFHEREARRAERRRLSGKPPKVFYKTELLPNGKRSFSGTPSLTETAVYPQRFCTALFQAWLTARLAAEGALQLQ